MPTRKLTAEILAAAIEGFEAQKRRIDLQIADLRQMLTGGSSEEAAPWEVPKGKRRKMSAAARKRIGDAQQKRWAESKRASEPSQTAAPSEAPKQKRKRRLSAAGKAAIVAALKKRWAAKRAAAVKAKPAVAKKSTAKKAARKKTAPKKAITKKAVARKAVKKAPVKVAVKRTTAKVSQNAAKDAGQVAAEVAAQ
jgi:hypothetical protein